MLCNLFKQREGRKKKTLKSMRRQKERTGNVERTCKKFFFLCSLKKKYLWVMLLNLEMNNKLNSSKKESKIIPVKQIELECKC